ncbi:MAG: tetratricopeptide repeat protein [Elusimicrobia bacterium]|nr:tetratricopeptide repeat protein [Elusimicrobiota bacterium]
MNLIFHTLFLAHAAAFAAAPPQPTGAEETIGREPASRAEAQAEQRRAADAAAQRKPVEGAAVTYEAVLADPDNVDLNYRFAQSQIAAGDLKGAIGTLERILMVNPGLHRVRLLYALVLYRLDNLGEAERELNTLTGLSLPDNLRSELEEYKRLINKRRRKTHVDLSAGFGFDYDSNRTAAPASEQLLVNNNFIALTPAHPDTADTAFVGMGNARITYDPGTQQGHEVFGGLGWYRTEQTVHHKLELQAVSLELGTVLKYGRNHITPKVTWGQVTLHEDNFLERSSFGIRYDRKITERLAADFEARMTDDVFAKTLDVAAAEERSGEQWDLAWGVGYILSPIMRVHGGYTFSAKNAPPRNTYNAFDRHAVHVNHALLLGKGMFFLTGLAMNFDLYDARDPAIGRNLREDITYRARLTFGVPLGLAHKYLKDLVFTQTYEYYRAESTVTNYAYDNNKLSSLITYRWGW